MTAAAWITLAILVVTFAVLMWNKLPTWLVFVGVLTAIMTLRLASPTEVLKGFSNTGVITVAALYPVAAGMYSTGAISLLSDRLIGLPRSITVAQIKVFAPVAFASAFLYDTPLVAMMIPAVRDLVRRTGFDRSKLFMGLSYIALLGGTITLIGTSTNLIVAGLVTEAIAKGTLPGAKPLALFDSMWIGIPVTAAGILFMIFIGSRILRDSTANTNLSEKRLYRGEFRVEPGSKIEHKTLTQAGLGTTASYAIDSIRRNGTSARPAPDFKLERDDILTFFAPAEVMPSIWATIGLVPVHASPMFSKRHRHQLVELIISDRAPAIGHRISELPLPDSPYQMMLVGISRYGRPPEVPLADLRLEPADAAIVEVDDEFFYENRREVDFLLTKRLDGFQVKRVDRALIAVAITVGMILLAALGLMPMLNAALLATFAMLLTGCLTIPRIWQSLDWQTIVVLGAAIALESAATSSGLSKAGAEFFTRFGGRSPMLALTAVFLGTVLLTNVVTNVAAAALMFSVASSLSTNLGVSFLPFAMILIVGASCTFVNPAAFSTNLMVQVPGGYQFSDYARVGLPLTILVAVITLVLTPIIYGF